MCVLSGIGNEPSWWDGNRAIAIPAGTHFAPFRHDKAEVRFARPPIEKKFEGTAMLNSDRSKRSSWTPRSAQK